MASRSMQNRRVDVMLATAAAGDAALVVGGDLTVIVAEVCSSLSRLSNVLSWDTGPLDSTATIAALEGLKFLTRWQIL